MLPIGRGITLYGEAPAREIYRAEGWSPYRNLPLCFLEILWLVFAVLARVSRTLGSLRLCRPLAIVTGVCNCGENCSLAAGTAQCCRHLNPTAWWLRGHKLTCPDFPILAPDIAQPYSIWTAAGSMELLITMTSHKRHGVYDHRQLNCLFSRLIRGTSNRITKLSGTDPLWGDSTGDR